MKNNEKRSTFSGKLGLVLSAAGASVGLGNIWRFPYLAAKYGMNVLDAGVSVLSMHAPWEITSRFDIEQAYEAYKAFLTL